MIAQISQLSPGMPTMSWDYPPMTAAGVKATLKSLRTRVGLRPDRITSTSLALDTLERLASVRYLQSQGLDRATAIVQAVRDAAAGLPVTESLIVDAALSLRLNAEAATGADLYAEDLSDRRLALLQEWDRLHTARGVLPPSAPTVRSLRLDQEDAALGLLASVLVGEELEQRLPRIAGPDQERPGEDGRAAVVIGAAVYDISCLLREHAGPQHLGAGIRVRGASRRQGAEPGSRPGASGREGSADQRARLGSGWGAEILGFLRTEGVDVDYIETRRGSVSPRAIVLASKNGSYEHIGWKNEHEVSISNAFLRSPAFQSVIETASAVLLTLEPSRDTIVTVLEVVSRPKRCPLIVTASPPIEGKPLSAMELRLIDYLIATDWELRYMLEDAGDDDDALSSRDIVERLLLAGVGTICVLGHNQCRIYGVPDDFVQPPPAAVIRDLPIGLKGRLCREPCLTNRRSWYGDSAGFPLRVSRYAGMLEHGLAPHHRYPPAAKSLLLKNLLNERAGSLVGGNQ